MERSELGVVGMLKGWNSGEKTIHLAASVLKEPNDSVVSMHAELVFQFM